MMNSDIDFKSDILNFITQIDSLNESLPLTKVILDASKVLTEADFQGFVRKRGDVIDGKIHYHIPSSEMNKFNRLRKRKESTELASKIVQRSFITSLVSQYDAYVGRIIRNILLTVPEFLNNSERKISFSELTNFDEIKDAREYVIEKEVESVLRDSHIQHFKYLESKLKIAYTKNLSVLPKFIEITERRNLFVHTDGKINSQYINVCKKNGIDIPNAHTLGKEITVTNEYFQEAYKTVYEIGVKLGIVSWRKISADRREEADELLNLIAYELIHENKYDLAINLLEFGLTMPKISSESIRLSLLINLSQAYKWKGDQDKAIELIESQDWSACSNLYKLCVCVIKDEENKAIELMPKVGENLSKGDYHEWPIFKKFRKNKMFKLKYQELFDEKFSESNKSDLLSSINRFIEKASQGNQSGNKKADNSAGNNG